MAKPKRAAKTGWMEKLRDADAKASGSAKSPDKKKATAVTMPPEVHEVTVQVRGPSGSDPGEVAIAHFIFENCCVTLTDQAGVPLEMVAAIKCPPTMDPRSIARGAASKRLSENNWFNRRLDYPAISFV